MTTIVDPNSKKVEAKTGGASIVKSALTSVEKIAGTTPETSTSLSTEAVDTKKAPEDRASIEESLEPEAKITVESKDNATAKEIDSPTKEAIEVKTGEKSDVLNPETKNVQGAQTVQQVLNQIAGYKAANALDPTNGGTNLNGVDPTVWMNSLQQTITTGDPDDATTWQAALLLKILKVVLRIK